MHRLFSEAEKFGAGSGSSAKQPPAIPVWSGNKAKLFQSSVVPQLAQKKRWYPTAPSLA
jgi:hypothetical protein